MGGRGPREPRHPRTPTPRGTHCCRWRPLLLLLHWGCRPRGWRQQGCRGVLLLLLLLWRRRHGSTPLLLLLLLHSLLGVLPCWCSKRCPPAVLCCD